MSVHSEDLLVHEIEQEQKQKEDTICVVSNKGITLFGHTISWVIVVLAVIGVFLYLNKNNFLTQSVKSVVEESRPTMKGGFAPELTNLNFNVPNPGQIRKLYGH